MPGDTARRHCPSTAVVGPMEAARAELEEAARETRLPFDFTRNTCLRLPQQVRSAKHYMREWAGGGVQGAIFAPYGAHSSIKWYKPTMRASCNSSKSLH